jgi:arylsulfatase A-like enzyme
VSLLDVTATVLAQAHAELSTHPPDGTDLVGLAQNPPGDRFVFSQLNRAEDGLYMAVNRRWKFVYSAPDQRELLFDRRKDPGETTDLGATTLDSEWPTQKAQNMMRSELIRWLTEQDEEAALENGSLRVYPKARMPSNPDASLIYQDHPWANLFISGYSNSEFGAG